VKVRLVPHFDWSDEGVLFNSLGGGSPKDNVGEYAHLKITGVTLSGKPSDSKWDPLKNAVKDVKVEIKDGAIIQITTDANNDGTINANDNQPSVKNSASGKVIRANTDDDDKNNESDKRQRPSQFDTAMNPAALAGTACYDCLDFTSCVHGMGHCWLQVFKMQGQLHAPHPYCLKSERPKQHWR
jgi:hypothetical protein